MIFPGGFGTLDELFEALTLIQTGKLGHFQSFCSVRHSQGLVSWIEHTLVSSGKIASHDRELIRLTDG